MEFVGDGFPLGEIEIDESDDCGGASGKILSVSAEIEGEAKEFAGKVKVFEGEKV